MGYQIKLKKFSKESYKIVVVRKKSSFRGKVLDYIGSYTYLKTRNMWIIRLDKIVLTKWLVKGAGLSNRLSKLLRVN